MQLEELPENLRARISPELEPGEKIFWMDQPRPATGFSWWLMAPSLFAIPWTGFTLFWIAGAVGIFDKGWAAFQQFDIQRILFGAFGIPFLLVGVGMFLSPLWAGNRRRKAARDTVYLITDRRALILNAGYLGDSLLGSLAGGAVLGLGKSRYLVTSYPPDKLGNIQRIQREDGAGDLAFGETILTSESNSERTTTRDGFFSVPDAREVEKMLRLLARSAESISVTDEQKV